MPGLTISTKDTVMRDPAAASTSSSSARRSSSPARPPVSPITPTLSSAQLGPKPQGEQQQMLPPFSQTRQTYTHSQPDQTGAPAPPAPPEPISFDDNPDVLALKSAISILQLQKRRAAADIRSLSRAKDAALADTEGFVADLAGGKVGTEGDRLFPDFAPRRKVEGPVTEEEDDDSSSSDEDEDEDEEMAEPGQEKDTAGSASSSTFTSASISPQKDGDKASSAQKEKEKRKGQQQQSAPPPAWRTLPKPQSVVRCPPINWSQYGVVGESLDKLHAEQQRAPTQGAPATLKPGAGGLTYEFKGGDKGEQKPLVGVAAPYAPGRDKLEKKFRGGKR